MHHDFFWGRPYFVIKLVTSAYCEDAEYKITEKPCFRGDKLCIFGYKRARLNNVGKGRGNCRYLLDEKEEKCYYSSMENSIEINRKLAKNLTYYRKAAGFTQAELAEKINYSDKSISKWESGNGVPDIYTLVQLAELYGVTLDTLLGDGAPVRVKKRTRTLRALVMLLSSGIVWLVATCFFVTMQLLSPDWAWWIAFVYAIPVNAIVLLVFSAIWKYKGLGFISVSVLIWLGFTCLFLTISHLSIEEDLGPLWSIFLLGIPLQVLEILWVFFRSVFKKNKKIVEVREQKTEN